MLAALLLLAACGGRANPSTEGAVVVHVEGGAGGVAAARKEEGFPVTADGLHPLITARAPYGAAPTSLLIDLLHPVITEETARKPPGPDTVLVLDPPVDGTLSWESPSRLRYAFTGAVPNDTTIKVTLESVETRTGKLPLGVSSTVHTPRFALHHLELVAVNAGKPDQTFEAAFTGPVDVATAADALKLVLPGGLEVPAVNVQAGSAPHKLKFSAASPALARGGTVDIQLGPGVRAIGAQATAVPARATAFLPTTASPAARVLNVRAIEGGGGFVLDVVCDDDAVEGDDRYWWDDEADRSYELSRRCELDPASLGFIHTEPAVDLQISATGHGFRLSGAFNRGHYAVHIDAGARTRDGGTFAAPWSGVLLVPGRSPEVRFLSQGRYLPVDGWRTLALQHRNLGAVDLQIRHIPRDNLLFWLSGDREAADERTSRLVVDTRLPVRGEPDQRATWTMDLSSALPSPEPGVYEVNVAFGDSRDTMRVVVSDLALIAKRTPTTHGAESVQVWALDTHTLAPQASVELSLLRPSGQELSRCTTGADGTCRLDAPEDPVDDTAALAIVASRGKELSYLSFREVEVPQAESDVSGEPFTSKAKLRASLDAERGVLRPGETLHLVGVLRDAAGFVAPPTELPVRLDVQDARGRVVRQLPLHGNEAGLLTAALPLSDDAPTGRWEARLVVADEVIARQTFAVEDFVPERMKVTAKVPAEGYTLADTVPVGVDARYLFGGSAEGARVEVRCAVEPAPFAPKKNKQLRYGHEFTEDLGKRSLDLGAATGTLDANGHADVQCPAPKSGAALVGPAKLMAEVAVFEAGSGRATRGSVQVPIHPAKHYLGLRTATSRASVGEQVVFEGMVVDWAGELDANAVREVELEVMRVEVEWDWVMDADSAYESWTRHRRAVPIEKRKVPVNGGKFSFRAASDEWAEGLLVRVRAGDASSDVVLPIGGGWLWDEYDGSDQDATPRPLAPTSVAIEAPETIKIGEPVQVSFEAPFAGRALVTLETDKLLHHAWIDVQPGPFTWTFQLDGWVPNAYVGALILKDPNADGMYLPDRAWGTRSVRVAPDAWAQALTLQAPAEVRSGAPLEITVTAPAADGPTWVALAAVDEGILQITKHPTPDPLAELQPRRALGLLTYETIGWNVARGAPGGAGGDAAGLPSRPSPIKPVALWAGLVELQDGKATVKLDIPEYNGALRVMAISASRDRVGRAEAQVLVRDPLIVQVTPPRYLLADDRAEIPIFLTNASGAAQSVEIAVQAEPIAWGGWPASAGSPLQFEGATSTTLSLADGASKTAVIRVRSAAASGAARLVVKAKAGAFSQTRSFDLPLIPSAPRTRRVQQVELAAGDRALSDLLTGWTPGTAETMIWVTGNPYAEALAHLSDLIRYPHGCIEQTTSGTRPLLYVRDLAPGLLPEVDAPAQIERMALAGIERVLSMQLPSGGFSYWPGGDEAALWGSAYATHMLLDARDAGFSVPAEPLKQAIDWLRAESAQVANSRSRYEDARLTEAYLHYVLARGGQPLKGRAQTLLGALTAGGEPTDGPTAEAVWLLRGALYLAGDRRHEAQLKDPDLQPLKKERRNDWTFYSDLRRRGIALSVYEDLFPGEAGGEALARLVASGVASSHHSWTTQELAWGITGLGKRSKGAGTGSTPATLTGLGRPIEGLEVASALPDRRFVVSRAPEIADLTLHISNPGTRLFAIVDTQGVRPDEPWRLGGEGLSITRALANDGGGPIDLSALKLGDVVHTTVTVTNNTGVPVRNVALLDRLAAGWEVENPRLHGDGEFEASWTPDHIDVRDDHLSLYGTLPPGRSVEVSWTLRATTAGTFTLPPIEVTAMYDDTVWARAPGGTVTIRGGWEASFL